MEAIVVVTVVCEVVEVEGDDMKRCQKVDASTIDSIPRTVALSVSLTPFASVKLSFI